MKTDHIVPNRAVLAVLAVIGLSACGSKVPDLSMLSESEAGAKLAHAGMRVGNVRLDITDPSKIGRIIAQTPLPGSRVSDAPGGSADIVVGGIQTPKLMDLHPDDAVLELKRVGLSLGSVKAVNRLLGKGTVTSQDPPVGTPIRLGAPVNLEVTTSILTGFVANALLDQLRSNAQYQKLDAAERQKIEEALSHVQ